jgi:hypothetical protein
MCSVRRSSADCAGAGFLTRRSTARLGTGGGLGLVPIERVVGQQYPLRHRDQHVVRRHSGHHRRQVHPGPGFAMGAQPAGDGAPGTAQGVGFHVLGFSQGDDHLGPAFPVAGSGHALTDLVGHRRRAGFPLPGARRLQHEPNAAAISALRRQLEFHANLLVVMIVGKTFRTARLHRPFRTRASYLRPRGLAIAWPDAAGSTQKPASGRTTTGRGLGNARQQYRELRCHRTTVSSRPEATRNQPDRRARSR